MPILNVAVTGQPDASRSARIASELTELTRVHLRKDPAVTAVAISYLDAAHWFAGGRSIEDQGAGTFWLDIKVVDGTNTKQELSAYLAAVFETMGRLVPGLHQESYILVHEVPDELDGQAVNGAASAHTRSKLVR